ncbi:MAG: hypothetical protein U9O06_00440 [Euryarchaeota archaeon]|nr:hypothetical protein [Euryarchaeota archaeon]
MADVRARFDGDSDRGQLLLVTALALAVMLVTVALLLNTAIFTENVATRDTTADGSEAIELRGEAVAAVGELIETENRAGDGDPDNVDNAVDAMGPLVDRERARHGTVATLSRNGSATSGQLLRWTNPDSDRPFDDPGTNWTLAESITESRSFTLELTEIQELSDPTDTEIEDKAFGVRFVNESTENRTLYLYEDSEHIVAERANETAPPRQQCAIDSGGGSTTVDITGDRLSTTDTAVDCYRGLWPTDSPDAIEFVNGGAADGTFSLVVDDSASPVSDSAVQNDPAVYSATVDITYQSQDLLFETTVRVAPGAPR